MTRQPLQTYLKLCTEFYDLEQHYNGACALSFYMDKALQANGPILEPMCGTGRFLIPMLQAGLAVSGFDASYHMLDALSQKYAQISTQKPPVWQQFVQDFNNNQRYALIFVPYGSWGLVTNLEESKNGLAALYRHLAPGGTLLLDIETVASVPQPCGVWRRGIHTRSDGTKIALSTLSSYDEQSQLFQARCRYESLVDHRIALVEEENFQQYLYRFDELDEFLLDVGFKQIKKYPMYDCLKTATETTPIVVYECIR